VHEVGRHDPPDLTPQDGGAVVFEQAGRGWRRGGEDRRRERQ